jgi:enoyl-[acyl-carrier protein] reductase II
VGIPVIAAGGIGSGKAMLAMFALGAEGVQIGSRFVASEESSCSVLFKNAVLAATEGDTALTLKEITPVRLLKNPFYTEVQSVYARSGQLDELKNLLGHGRAKRGMFEGDLTEGELEIGQVSASISAILPAKEIVSEIIAEFESERKKLGDSASIF